MKFISKAANYRIILRHGQRSEPLTGRLAVPGLYVKFEDGVAVIPSNGLAGVSREEIFEMLKGHEAFGKDFVLVEDNDHDPYTTTRKQKEPEHTIFEMQHGAIVGAINAKRTPQIDQKQKALIMSMATEIAKQMAPKLAEDLLKKMVAQKQEETDVLKNQKGEEISADAEVPMSYEEAHPEETEPVDPVSVEATVDTESVIPEVSTPEDEPKKKGRPRKSKDILE